VDLVGFAPQCFERLPVVTRGGETVGQPREHVELRARVLEILLEQTRRELGWRGVAGHGLPRWGTDLAKCHSRRLQQRLRARDRRRYCLEDTSRRDNP